MDVDPATPTRRRRRMVAAAITVVTAVVCCVGGWLVHGYLYDASFMHVPDGYTGVSTSTCETGEALYIGYEFLPTHSVHLTGAELVGVSGGLTIDGVYAVNARQSNLMVVGGATQQDWDRMGYSKAHLYPVSDVNLPAGGMGDWWLVAKIVPNKPDKQMIQGIRVSYSSGWRSGSTVYNERVTSDCPS